MKQENTTEGALKRYTHSAHKAMAEDLATWEMDEERYLALLGKLVGESEHLQNNPPDLVPTEDRGKVVLVAGAAAPCRVPRRRQTNQTNKPPPTSNKPKAARHVLELLEPLSTEHGGPIELQHVSFVEGRGNIKVGFLLCVGEGGDEEERALQDAYNTQTQHTNATHKKHKQQSTRPSTRASPAAASSALSAATWTS